MADETYQTKIYTLQGGDERVYESGATLNIESGATISMISGATFGLAGENINVDDLRKQVISNVEAITIGIISASTSPGKLSVINLPKNVKIVYISGTSNMVSASFWLTSVSAGREVWILFGTSATSTASNQIDVSCSGCTLRGSVGTLVSGFEMHLSNSFCGVHLISPADNVWAIVNQFGDIDE